MHSLCFRQAITVGGNVNANTLIIHLLNNEQCNKMRKYNQAILSLINTCG